MNEIAPEGQIFICAACGKKSKDKYGERRISYGWDESCVLNSVLVYEVPDEKGMYTAVPGQTK